MNIDWTTIFYKDQDQYEGAKTRPKKFSRLPKLLPWGEKVDENVWLTLEWLIREGRDDTLRFSEDALLNPVRGSWYTAEYEDGRFIHVCYQKDLLKFRGQYESLYNQIKELKHSDIMKIHKLAESAREKLWSAWNCLGGDGDRNEPSLEEEEHWDLGGVPNPYASWPRVWNNKCKKCGEPLPKALQMWVKLQHSKLKDAR